MQAASAVETVSRRRSHVDSLRPALFVALEGALVDSAEFGSDLGPIAQVRGAREALAAIARGGFVTVVVANQSGLALGRFSRSQFCSRELRLQRELRDAGVDVGPFIVCPHLPRVDGLSACLCRLPAPGLLVRAARSMALDLARSWIVGTKPEEVEAGRRAGCRSVLLRVAHDQPAPARWPPLRKQPDRNCAEWDEVAHEVLAERQREHALL